MKKLKKALTDKANYCIKVGLFKPEIKCSRVIVYFRICNYEMNAGTNSTLNIKSRVLNKELRARLNNDNVYLGSRTKTIYYKNVKTMIEDVYNLGVVTEFLPTNMIKSIEINHNISCIELKKEKTSLFRAGD